MTRLRRLLATVAVVTALSGAFTGVASAHAALLGTTPADQEAVDTDPGLVTATFSERVSVDVGGLSVRDTDGQRVDQGESTIDDAGTTVSVGLQPGLPDGIYVVTYRVLSADGHPVSGAWNFGIGDVQVQSSVASAPSDGGWETVGALARFVTYLGALLAAGVAFFLAFLHDRRPDRAHLARIVQISAPVAVAGTIGSVVAQAALLTGRGLGATADVDVLRSVLTDRLGWSAAVLLLGLAAVYLSIDVRERNAILALAAVGGLAVTGSFALWGHDTEAPNRWLAVGADVVHVAAAAIWLGGLVGLLVVLRRRPPYPVATTAGIVVRFSTVAAFTVGALVAAGLAMSWIELGSLRGLWETDYGRLLLAKTAITLAILVMAALNRFRIIPAIVAGGPDRDHEHGSTGSADDTNSAGDARARQWQRLRRTVAAEAFAIVAVLGVTSVLVNTTPARTALPSSSGPVTRTNDVDTGTVSLVVAPAAVGRNTMTIRYLDDGGNPVDLASTLTVELTLPEQDLGPIQREVLKSGPGQFVLEGNELSLPGDWQISVSARTSDFTEQSTTFTVPVRR